MSSEQVNLDKIPGYLQRQRWFAGKAWPIKAVTVLDHVRLPAPPPAPEEAGALLAVVEVIYELGTPERYLIPVLTGPDGELEDALLNDDVARALFQLVREGGNLPTAAGALRGERFEVGEHWRALPERPEVRRLTAEQSNTSVVFDDRIIFKLIRRIEPGENPEYEVGCHLAAQSRFRAAPELLGALHLEGPLATTAAVAHRFLADVTDGWSHVVSAFKQAAPSPDLLEELGELGRVLAELHQALGQDTGAPAWSPEPVAVEDLQRWSSSIIGELGVTLNQAQPRFPQVMERQEELVDRVRRLAHLPPGGKKIRIHGDLHLGQVLRSAEGWIIFDFEGEPGRGYSQRREKQSPLKDVAGMLRSFSYAMAAAVREGGAPGGYLPKIRGVFLDGYLGGMKGSGLLPESEDALYGQLEALELEKLLYEVRYEINNRPDWASIPIEALMKPEGRE